MRHIDFADRWAICIKLAGDNYVFIDVWKHFRGFFFFFFYFSFLFIIFYCFLTSRPPTEIWLRCCNLISLSFFLLTIHLVPLFLSLGFLLWSSFSFVLFFYRYQIIFLGFLTLFRLPWTFFFLCYQSVDLWCTNSPMIILFGESCRCSCGYADGTDSFIDFNGCHSFSLFPQLFVSFLPFKLDSVCDFYLFLKKKTYSLFD